MSRSPAQQQAIRRCATARRAARLRQADRILADVVALGRPDWRRERERSFVDAYARRVLLVLDGPISAARLTGLAADALREAGWRCALRDVRSRTTRRKARAMIRDSRTHEALRDKFTDAGLTGDLIAKRLRDIIEDEDAEHCLKAIDIAIKVTGDYAPTKQHNLNVNAGRGNIFEGGGIFARGVGKPIVDGELPALVPASPLTPLEQELPNVGLTQPDQQCRDDHDHRAAQRHRDD